MSTVVLGVEHADKQSNWKQYTYQRNEFTVGMEWLFLEIEKVPFTGAAREQPGF